MTTQKRLQNLLKSYQLNVMEYHKKGLRNDDLFNPEHFPKIQYALSTLPKHVQYSKNYRMCKAIHNAYNEKILPAEEHTDINNDAPYLKDTIAEVDEKLQYIQDLASQSNDPRLLLGSGITPDPTKFNP